MAGFQLDTINIPKINDYTAALKVWESIKPWRDKAECDPRPLDKLSRRKRHVNIHLRPSGAIACTLHYTDVVTYESDGRVIIDPSYVSNSTTVFADAVLPNGVKLYGKVVWTGWGPPYYWHDNPKLRGWNTEGKNFAIQCNLDGQWMPCEEPKPFTKRVLNRERAAFALKRYDYADFRAWRMAYLAIDQGKHNSHEHMAWDDILTYLSSSEGWVRLAYAYDLKYVREQIYAVEKCYDFIDVPFITSSGQFKGMWD